MDVGCEEVDYIFLIELVMRLGQVVKHRRETRWKRSSDFFWS
jgi:hypothetical protein